MYALAPPRHLVREIQRYDPALNLRFHVGRCRWCVTRKVIAWGEQGDLAYTMPVELHVFDVKEPDGAFRPPDRRILRSLYWGDLWRVGAEQAADILDTAEAKEKARRDAEREELFVDMAKDNHEQLHGSRWQVPERVEKFRRGLRKEFAHLHEEG